MRFSNIICPLAIFITISCGSNSASGGGGSQVGTSSFTKTQIPISITEPEDRADYYITHYWDNYNFADTALLHNVEVTEQAFVDFLDVMRIARAGAVSSGIDKHLNSAIAADSVAGVGALPLFRDLYERYLWDPNSPMRNDELYIVYLGRVIGNKKIADIDKVRAEYQMELASKNRVGHKAADFKFAAYNGEGGHVKRSLYRNFGRAVGSDFTVVFFYNPDCQACKEIRTTLVSSGIISVLEKRGRLNVLAVYTDQDLNLWTTYAKSNGMPAHWVNGYTMGVQDDISELYDLKAIPTMYLLDSENNVLLKDATVWQIEEFLGSL